MLRTSTGGRLLVAAFVLAALSPGVARAETRVERVHFERGAESAVIEGTLRGDEIVDCVLGASKGQHANVSMATNNGSNYFNILAPGETEVAFFNGSVSDNKYEGTLPATGDYKIPVYLMRSAALRNEVAKYRLEMAISGPTHASASHDALVPGTGFHATAMIPCVAEPNKAMAECDARVERRGDWTIVRIGEVEVYEIPDALVFGG